jgi:hypothetical protein
MPRPSRSPSFDHIINIRWRLQVMKLFIMQSSPFSCYLGPHILLSILFSNILSLCSSLSVNNCC